MASPPSQPTPPSTYTEDAVLHKLHNVVAQLLMCHGNVGQSHNGVLVRVPSQLPHILLKTLQGRGRHSAWVCSRGGLLQIKEQVDEVS